MNLAWPKYEPSPPSRLSYITKLSFLPEIPNYCKWLIIFFHKLLLTANETFSIVPDTCNVTTVLRDISETSLCAFCGSRFWPRQKVFACDRWIVSRGFFSPSVVFLAFPMSIVFGPFKQNLYSAALASQFANEVCFHSGSPIYPPQHYILGPKEYLL